MIPLRLQLDTKQWERQLVGFERQIPFVTAIALNRTVEDALARARREIAQRFIVRVPGFIYPPVQLPRVWRATKQNPTAIFALGDGDGGSEGIGARRSSILSKFQAGGIKSASDPLFPIAIPTRAIRPNPRALVPQALYPKNLGLAPRRDVSGGTVPVRLKGAIRTLDGRKIGKRARKQQQLQGIGGTFTINSTENGRPIGVFQRTGAGRKDVRMIWAYRQSIVIPRRLDWDGIARRTAEERWAINFEGALALAMRTAR
jgi:hypothetical protein